MPSRASKSTSNSVVPVIGASMTDGFGVEKDVVDDNYQLLPGINDLSDALEALPFEMVRHFTLLKEIDAKCVASSPKLFSIIPKLVDNKLDEGETKESVLDQIRTLIRDLLGSLEEKMHVAGVAADAMDCHLKRIEYDHELIVGSEIPHVIQFGIEDDPAFISPEKIANQNKSTRSETRREAVAAKKAAAAAILGTNGLASGGRGAGSSAENSLAGNINSKRAKSRGASSQPNEGIANGNGAGGYANNNASNNGNGSAHSDQATISRKRNRGEYGSGGARDDFRDESPVYRPDTPQGRSKRAAQRRNHRTEEQQPANTSSEPVYCYCNQVSYGEMVGCDGPTCRREWFHLPCIGLDSVPKGHWYCEDCRKLQRTR